MKKIIGFLFTALLLCIQEGKAQDMVPFNGVKNGFDKVVYALTNANIVVDDKDSPILGTIVFSEGKIIAVGKKVDIPPGAVIKDMKQKWVYPSFIDASAHLGMPKVKPGNAFSPKEQFLSEKQGARYWNEHVQPELTSLSYYNSKTKFDDWLQAGFGVVNTYLPDGIVRGRSFVMALGKNAPNSTLLKNDAAMEFSLIRGSSEQAYPTSKMGAVALLRQFFEDARWYKVNPNVQEKNVSLEEYNRLSNIPKFFQIENALEIRNVLSFNQDFIIVGNGMEYTDLPDFNYKKVRFVLPLNFPKPFDLSNPFVLNDIPYRDLKHWQLAPHNPSILLKNKAEISLSCADKPQNFLKNLREAVRYGLPEKEALKALTSEPAKWLGIDSVVGSLEKGKWADFFVADKNIFQKNAKVLEHWIQGKKMISKNPPNPNFAGTYTLVVDNSKIRMNAEKDADSNFSFKFSTDTTALKYQKLTFKNNTLQVFFNTASTTIGALSLEGHFSMENQKPLFKGVFAHNFKPIINFKTVGETNNTPQPKSEKKEAPIRYFDNLPHPFQAYGVYDDTYKSKNWLIKNATVWTNGTEGILKNTDVLVKDGVIVAIGKNLQAPKNGDYQIVDATGKDLTPGIIDEHSHIAIRGGVNECSQAVTAEVSVADAIDPTDIDIYHSLAGGVVAAQLLHGSCNPIGGKSALVRLKWGETADNMLIQGAAPFIKFALGENVKRSNFGDAYVHRFPQTRMGVEQVYNNAFNRALEYEKLKQSGIPYRKDYELETVLEIVRGKRFVTCHSYVQSEINMLMKIAEKYGFRINTFTHILEGYKVADIIRKHGAYASTFSDWWAYKFEVKDAIPYNAAILHNKGVVTAINSDDAEMERRLNQEAAKVVKYGGLSEEEALKMVTLNPAKMLHLDDKMGSIEKGKEASIVIWSGDPLSVYSKAEKTIIEGIEYFDIEKDKQLREFYAKEREHIMQQMADAIAAGETPEAPIKTEK